jgi:MYXO-CTERM domain-containing protein
MLHSTARWTLLALGWFAFTVGCTGAPPSLDDGMGPPAGAVRGELSAQIATFDDGTTETRHFLHPLDDPDRELRLFFDSEPDLAPGTRIDVWGTAEGEGLRVRRFQLAPAAALAELAAPLITAMPNRPRSFAFALVRIGNTATPLDPMVATQRLFGTDPAAMVPSVRQYYVEVSYGQQDIGGSVFGPFDMPSFRGCDTGGMARTLRAMIPGTFDHYLWYMEPRAPGCGWSGLANTGTPQRPSRDTWYNNAAGCVVLVQEPGHNFGMAHSSAMKCPGAPFVDQPNGACQHQEYGDRYDPMGSACRHMNAYQKVYEGWFGKCNLVDAPSSGTFTIVPLELPCDGLQALAVPMPKVRLFAHSGGGGGGGTDRLSTYVVELRSPIGIDSGLTPVVQIRVSSDRRERTQLGLHTWFLDMDPSTPALDGLVAGQSFTDPSGSPKITVVALEANKATVRVEFAGGGTGTPTCLDSTPFTTPGPGPESCAAAPAAPSGQPPVIVRASDGGVSVDAELADASGAASAADASPLDPRPRDAAPPTTPDAGAPDRGMAPSQDASAIAPASVAGGCGCRVGPRDPGPGVATAVTVGLLGALLLRRRPRPRG